MISFMDLIENHVDNISKDRLLEIVSSLKNSSQQGFTLLEELLEWARSQTGAIAFNPLETSLHKIVEQNIKLQNQKAEMKRVTIENIVPAKANILADRYMLDTILRNLISNAIKYTPEKGKIQIAYANTKKWTRLSIIDNGVGMTEDQLKSLFRIDSNMSTPGTNNEQGTGLGLIICKEFVSKHKGEIWAESNSKGGTIFNINFPSSTTTKIEKPILQA